MAISGRSCLVNSCKIIHFGMNPVSGGSPPRDSIVTIVSAVSTGAFVQLVASVLSFVAVTIFRAMKAEDVMMM